MAKDRKGPYFFMWNARYFCMIATWYGFLQPVVLIAGQRESSFSMRTDEQRDQTKSIVSFIHGDNSSDVNNICANNIARTLIQLWQQNQEKRECFCAWVFVFSFFFFYFLTSHTQTKLYRKHCIPVTISVTSLTKQVLSKRWNITYQSSWISKLRNPILS